MPDEIDALTDQAEQFALAVNDLGRAMNVHPVTFICGLRLLLEVAEDAAAEWRAAGKL